MRAAKIVGRVAFALLAFTLATGSALGQEVRTWKDASGKFSIKAKFVSVDKGMLTLAREDGEEVEIELKKLCDADQKYVAELAKDADNPFKKTKADPFKAKKSAMPRAKGAATAASSSGEARPVNADWSQVRNLVLAPEKAEWAVTVAAPEAAPTFKPRPVGVPPKSNFFEGCKGLFVSADGKHAAIGYTTDEPKPAGVTRLVLIDLEKGKSLASITSPGKFAPLALGDDGTRLLMRREEFGFGKNDRMEVWNVDGATLIKEISFFPYDNTQGGDRDIKWAAFLGPDKAITLSNKGKLATWDLESARAGYTLDIQGNSVPALSPDRKLLAFLTGKEVGLLDVDSGAVQALAASPNTPFAALAFSPSGKKFAVAAIDKLYAYDTATGALLVEMLLTGTAPNGEVVWTDEDHILIHHQYLCDLTNQVKLWQYQGAERAAQVGSTTLFLVENGEQSGALVGAQLPQPSAKAELARAMADPEFFVLKPGSGVKIQVDGIADPSRRDEVSRALAQKMDSVGAKVNPSASLEVVASTELGKQRDIAYQTFGRGFGTQNYKVQEYISRIKFVYQGKVAWESSSYNIPRFVKLRNGQTMEQYLKEQEKPNYEFFSRVEIPKLLTKPTGKPAIGFSRVSSAGVR